MILYYNNLKDFGDVMLNFLHSIKMVKYVFLVVKLIILISTQELIYIKFFSGVVSKSKVSRNPSLNCTCYGIKT